MWIRPTMVIVLCAVVLAQFPPRLADIGWLAGALVIGTLIGWQRGRFVKIIVDPETHVINQKASPAAMAFLLVVVIARVILRQEATSAWHVSAGLVTDASILFVVGVFGAQQLEMWLRARRLLEQARAAKIPRGSPAPPEQAD